MVVTEARDRSTSFAVREKLWVSTTWMNTLVQGNRHRSWSSRPSTGAPYLLDAGIRRQKLWQEHIR